jgi:hypothetical protein
MVKLNDFIKDIQNYLGIEIEKRIILKFLDLHDKRIYNDNIIGIRKINVIDNII